MPLYITTSELQVGMRLAEPVRVRGRTLLAAQRELTRSDVQSLRRRYPNIRVRVVDPILDEVADFEDDGRERDVADEVRTTIAGAMGEVEARFSSRASLDDVDFYKLQKVIEDVIEQLKEHAGSVALLSSVVDKSHALCNHTGNVFYLSMMLGCAVRDYVYEERMRQANMKGVDPRSLLDLTPLGMGAMFMDVGMLPLRNLYREQRTLTPAEHDLVTRHPLVGADLLPETISPVARSIVRTHHENYAGSGYPRGVDKDRLQIFTRIVRIADAFDTATSAHMYSHARSSGKALWEMTIGPYRRFYDPRLIHVFGRMIQPFPIGAKLRLADGRYAVVVRYNRHDPFKPYVLIAFDRDNRRLPSSQLDGPFALSARSDVHVARWGDEDLAYVYEDDDDQPQVSEPGWFKTLFEASYP